MIGFTLAALVGAAVSLWVVPQVLRFAVQRGLLDPSAGHKTHAIEVPRIGGVGIAAGFVAGSVVGLAVTGWSWPVAGTLLGALVMFGVGLSDDLLHDKLTGRLGLTPPVKLALQIIAAAIPIACGVKIDHFKIPGDGYVMLPPLVAQALTLIWIVGVANALNFIDGLDGLAGGVALIMAATVAVIGIWGPSGSAGEAMLALALVGGLVGFLRLNFPPARIYMGDGGALLLGFVLACVAVSGVMKSATLIAVVAPLLILALPIVNLTQVVVGRVVRGQNPMAADRTHLHDRLQDAGWSRLSAVLFSYAISGLCASAALSLMGLPLQSAILSGVVAALLVWVAARRPKEEM